MLIDEQFRKCTTFLFVDKRDEETGACLRAAAATAFFIGVPVDDGYPVVYAITARHVIDASRPYGRLFVRVNTADGRYDDLATPQDDWVGSPASDVAANRVALEADKYDMGWIPLSNLATDGYLIRNQVGPGDHVFFVGLFSEHPGQTRNQPIIRFGNISLMPHEKIHLRLDPASDAKTPIDAFLVEARSWGGHSGSPAFVYFTPDRKGGTVWGAQPSIRLLGLVQGHYEIAQDVAFIGDIVGSAKVPVNAGMAVVVPAQKIIDTLMQEDLVEERSRILAQRKQQGPAERNQG